MDKKTFSERIIIGGLVISLLIICTLALNSEVIANKEESISFSALDWTNLYIVDDPHAQTFVMIPDFIYSVDGVGEAKSSAVIDYMLISPETGKEVPSEEAEKLIENYEKDRPTLTISDSSIVELDPLYGSLLPKAEGNATLFVEYRGSKLAIPISVVRKQIEGESSDLVKAIDLDGKTSLSVNAKLYNKNAPYKVNLMVTTSDERYYGLPADGNANIYVKDEEIAEIAFVPGVQEYLLIPKSTGSTVIIAEALGRTSEFPLEVFTLDIKAVYLEVYNADGSIDVIDDSGTVTIESARFPRDIALFALMEDGSVERITMNENVYWVSSNPNVASDGSMGTIYGEAKGEASIACSAFGFKLSVDVIVKE